MSTSAAERLQAMMAHACFGKDADAAFAADLPAYLEQHGVAREDIDALTASPRRLGLYRRLVRHNVINVVGIMLERTRDRLEKLAPGAFAAAIDGFLDEQGPKTPHLRDVPGEFLAWAAPKWREDPTLPAWLVDHAELELVDFTIGVAPRPLPPPPLDEVAADRPLVFGEPTKLLALGWAVHEMPEDEGAPAQRRVHLFVYRDEEHRARILELTPLAAAILERLVAGRPLAAAMVEACEGTGAELDQAVLSGAARLLADLGERGVLLGARARALG